MPKIAKVIILLVSSTFLGSPLEKINLMPAYIIKTTITIPTKANSQVIAVEIRGKTHLSVGTEIIAPDASTTLSVQVFSTILD
jgi:hypothetical protein